MDQAQWPMVAARCANAAKTMRNIRQSAWSDRARIAFGIACSLVISALGSAAWADVISLTNISQNLYNFGSVLSEVKVSPTNPNLLAVAWRRYLLPINTNGSTTTRVADCHVAISLDSGTTFQDTNLMPFLREPAVNVNEPEPNLYFCNQPWVAFGSDGVMYAGGSLFTPLGTIGPSPKQGRVKLTVSADFGVTWSAPTYGIRFNNFAPGLTGLGGGTAPEDTPWDGSNGFADPSSASFYTTSSGYVTASNDHANSFSTVYELTTQSLAGWTVGAVGVMNANSGILGAPFTASASPIAGTVCPCLGYATSLDHGKTWSAQLVAQAAQFNSTTTGDTARTPFSASDPSAPGTRVAISAYTLDHKSVQVFYTQDGGSTWQSAAVTPPTGVTIATAGKPGVGYTLDGGILVVWRGYEVPNAVFDTFAALLHGSQFGPTIRVSPRSSKYPYLTMQAACTAYVPPPPTGACYDTANGGGDFVTWITGNHLYAFVTFPYIPDGFHEDMYFARIPLSMM
jgi:hypothetical protein